MAPMRHCWESNAYLLNTPAHYLYWYGPCRILHTFAKLTSIYHQGFEKDATADKAREVPRKVPDQFTHHHYRNEDKEWFTMENQGMIPQSIPWKFGVLYGSVSTKEDADKAMKNLNNTRYVLYKPPFMPVPY